MRFPLLSFLVLASTLLPVDAGGRKFSRKIHMTARDKRNVHKPKIKFFDFDDARKNRRRIAAHSRRTASSLESAKFGAISYGLAGSRKYSYSGFRKTASTKTTGLEVIETDDPDGQGDAYWGDLYVGSPPQLMTVDFDTGSSDLIIPLSNCTGLSDFCVEPLFASQKSSSYKETKKTFTVEYGDESGAAGKIASDKVSVAGLTVKTQYFGAANTVTESFSGPWSGLIGLGFPANALSGVVPWFTNLVNSETLVADLFSMYLTRHGASGSSLCLGCIESAKYTGNLSYYPIDTAAYKNGKVLWWNVASSGLSYGGALQSTTMSVIIDSGSTFIYAPTKVTKALYDSLKSTGITVTKVPIKTAGETGWYRFPCEQLSKVQTVAFRIGATDYAIDADDFNAGMYTDPQGVKHCVGGIVGDDMGGLTKPMVVAGDAFMKNWYTVFDYEHMRVGFAKSV